MITQAQADLITSSGLGRGVPGMDMFGGHGGRGGHGGPEGFGGRGGLQPPSTTNPNGGL